MLPSLTYAERYRNLGTRTYSKHADYTEADERYRPDGSQESFLLTPFRVSKERLLIYSANPPPEILSYYVQEQDALFCLHPQTLERSVDPYLEEIRAHGTRTAPLRVSPSSSTRTLFVLDGYPDHALKVHFPFRVSRYGRKMRDEVIEQAVNVSRELEADIDLLDQRFAFLREPLGIAHVNLDTSTARGENWGYLVRDMRPFPLYPGEKPHLLPGFALYGQDFFAPDAPPLLHALIDQDDPLAVVLESIMLPIVRHWVDCYLHFGYMMEPHGQNTLLEIDTAGKIRRIVHRDLSVGLDMRRRRDVGRSATGLNNYNRMESGEFTSITYDMFTGSHFFDRIVTCCCQHSPHLQAEDFRRPCRELFARLFPDHARYMPRTVHYFSEQRDRFNKPLFVDTGQVPCWRP
ncbi:MAG: hypothetical protein CSA21_03155 [Deltaproteobacteria bacterium]|nr:MAG: hypothetical protein CSA21_03155 [Deltaproteobacteria bacterium]